MVHVIKKKGKNKSLITDLSRIKSIDVMIKEPINFAMRSNF